CTHTTPPPSGPLTTPTPGAISAASCGRSGSGTWVSIRAIIPPPPAAANLSSIIAEMWRRSKPRGTGKGIKDQTGRRATPRNQAAMSGALGAGPLRGPLLYRLAPPRHPRRPRPGLLHHDPQRPKSACAGMTLYQVLHELQIVL